MVSAGMIYAIIAILAFIGIMILLDRFDLLEPYGFELSGPFLMWKTKKGRSIIERISQKKRFWENFGSLGIVIVSICMVLIFLMVAWSAYVATSIPADQAPQANEVLVLPGINPIIPVGYGIMSMAVAIIVHEFSHGILFRVFDVELKSLGLLFLVVPLGAFAEPDEDDLEAVEKKKRGRIYSAGPASNMVLAIIIVLIFSTLFMGSVTAKKEGLMVTSVYDDTPAERAGIEEYDEILKIGNHRIKCMDDLNSIDLEPMQEVDVQVMRGNEERSLNATTGLVITGVFEGYPAEEKGLERGDIIYSIDGEVIKNSDEFEEVMEGKNDKINLTYQRREDGDYEQNQTEMGFKDEMIGVNYVYLGVSPREMDWLPNLLSNPISGAESFSEVFQNSMFYIALPFFGLSPMPEGIAQLYEVTGPLSVMPTGAFWMVANSLYWIFWLNLLVGLFNSLPAVPLDGGHMFNDGIQGLTEKLGIEEGLGEKISDSMTMAVALLILFLLLWQMIGPRI